MRNKILLFSLLIGSISFQGVNAGVVPGTIQTNTVTANVSCSSSSNYYAPTNGYCDNWTKTAKVGSWDYLYDYSGRTGNGGYYAPGPGFTAIDSGETCSWESQGTNHTPHTSTSFSCTFGSGTGVTYDTNSYESGGFDGVCSPKKGVNNLISTYDQVGGISRTTSLTSSACKVEGRYATTDNSAPLSTLNSVSKVFLNNDAVWCNIEKYRDSGYDKKLHPGCAEYAKQNTNISGNQDLLKGLDINIDNDISGIWKVDIKLGTCSVTYESPVINSGILQSTTSASGVKPQYTNGFTIKYNTSFIAFGVSQPGLLSKMGVSRLDDCLGNGKNNLVVTTYDMSRGADGVTLAGNSKTFTTPGIFIDNNTSVLDKTGDLSKDNSSDPNMWRNFSLEGNIKVGEDYSAKGPGECTLNTGTGTCTGLKPGFVWTAPLGVNPNTGIFTQYSCDGFTFPLDTECVQQPLPTVSKICTGTVPSNALLSNTGGLLADTPWQNIDSTASCYFEIPVVYCKAGGTVPCVVKPGGPIVVTPPVNGMCGPSNSATFSTAPTTGLCDSGVPTIVNGSGPWTWICQGANLGTDASCSASKGGVPPSITGVCGAANGATMPSQPTVGLCSSGAPSTISGSGPWTWTCNGSGGGGNDSCNANKTVVTVCNYEPTITGGGGKFGGGPGPRCYNNAANSGGGVNVKYTCDASGNLFYDGSPSIVGAYRYLGADKENCFVSCVKPTTCN